MKYLPCTSGNVFFTERIQDINNRENRTDESDNYNKWQNLNEIKDNDIIERVGSRRDVLLHTPSIDLMNKTPSKN